MRSFAAIAIVCLLLSAWIGGFRRCGEATHQLRLLHRMNARDAAVARQLEERLAGNRLIKVVDEAHVERRGHFYSNDALFSLDVEGETVHFFVIHESKTLDYETEYEAAPPASRDERPLVNLNDFFKHYLFPAAGLPSGSDQSAVCHSFVGTTGYCAPFLSVPQPPPDLSC